jgi:transposase
MKEFTFFIGIDVSKHTLDCAVSHKETIVYESQIENSSEAIEELIKQVRRENKGFELNQALFCMEYTGIYNTPALTVMKQKKIAVCLESARQIRYSLGVHRGKNDRIDAQRIALYANLHQRQLQLWSPPRETLQRLHVLVTTRSRLIRAKQQLKVPLKETSIYLTDNFAKSLMKITRSSIQGIEKDIKAVDSAIKHLIKQDNQLGLLCDLITSVDGVGINTALEIIISTKEFQTIKDPKKLACHAGVAPYEHRSGSSVRGKSRVSHHANKKLKKLLHMAALSAIQMEGDLKQFYQRKVAEGKNKMLVLNAVRNKLIHRVFAVVRDQRKYEKSYLTVLD